jgi:hypothetical protein
VICTPIKPQSSKQTLKSDRFISDDNQFDRCFTTFKTRFCLDLFELRLACLSVARLRQVRYVIETQNIILSGPIRSSSTFHGYENVFYDFVARSLVREELALVLRLRGVV